MPGAHLPDAVAAALSEVPAWGGSDGAPAHLLTGLEPGRTGVLALLDLADQVRRHERDICRMRPLAGRVFAGMFFDPSLRTRASMQVACAKLGAEFLDLQPGSGLWTLEFQDEVTMDGVAQEHIKEAVGALGRYADVLGLRAFPARGRWQQEREQPIHKAFAAHAGVSVVNLEGPLAHPCQGLADAMTLRDILGEPRGHKLVLTWTPHPSQGPMAVANSAIWAAASLGMEVVLVHPEGFELDPLAHRHASDLASEAGGSFRRSYEQAEALAGADVVYAESWGATSGPDATLGGHADAVASLRDWTIVEADLEAGAPARFMHCLPVRRNVVVSDGVLDGPLSSVLDQTENRLWVQAALLLALLGREEA
jgi:N-acetylornithine carbamoyltransferase